MLCKTVVEMKLIGEGSFGDSDEKLGESARYILSLGTVDAMAVGFKEIDKVYNFAAHDPKVPVERASCSHADKLAWFD